MREADDVPGGAGLKHLDNLPAAPHLARGRNFAARRPDTFASLANALAPIRAAVSPGRPRERRWVSEASR